MSYELVTLLQDLCQWAGIAQTGAARQDTLSGRTAVSSDDQWRVDLAMTTTNNAVSLQHPVGGKNGWLRHPG
jgi:hypothetical protein